MQLSKYKNNNTNSDVEIVPLDRETVCIFRHYGKI